jgi:integrase
MAGQVIPRGKNTWLLRVFLGRDGQTGKRQYYNETFYGGRKEAGETLLDALRDRKQGKITIGAAKLTVSALLDDLLRDYRVNGQSIDWAEIVANTHLRPFLGEVRISKFSTSHVQNYIDSRRAKGRKNATINRELSLLRRAFAIGAEHDPPKVKSIPKIRLLEENNVRKGFFEHEEYTALLKTLPPELRPVLTFAYYTGCRKGEILGLQWSQVDLLEQVVRLEAGTTKNDEPRMIPLAPELYEVLKMQKAIRDQEYPACPWVFFRYGKEILDFRGAWEEACQAAKLWNELSKKPTKLFHDLRRTGVRNLVRAGVPESVAMRISGHKTRSVFERYNIVTEADLKSAAQRLGQYIQEKAKASEVKATPEKITKRIARVQ